MRLPPSPPRLRRHRKRPRRPPPRPRVRASLGLRCRGRQHCDRRRYKRNIETDCAVRGVPSGRVRRVIHVVPDFTELTERKVFRDFPAAPDSPLAERLAMQYFLNVFFPWDVWFSAVACSITIAKLKTLCFFDPVEQHYAGVCSPFHSYWQPTCAA